MTTPLTLPLRTRLTLLVTAVLVLGLVLSGLVAQTFLRRALVAQIDTELATVAPQLVRLAGGGGGRGLPGPREDSLPSDYHVLFSSADGEPVTRWSGSTSTTATVPDLPSLDAQEALALQGRPFTLRDDGGWRVLVSTLARGNGEVIGTVAVALPLEPVTATLGRMRAVLVAIGLVTLAVGAAAGWWGVRTSLRPLREMETTAGAIAAGDLTRRVPEAPPGTEVGSLAAALNQMLGQVERAFAARSASEQRMRRFVADASHELRTPLATIRGYAELHRMGAAGSPEEVDHTLHRIEQSAVRLGALVEDLLQLARLDEGVPLRQEPVDLSVLAADAVADLHALDPGRAVRLVRTSGPGAVVVPGDEARLRQVLANLVGNAVRHTPEGTPVEIAVGWATPGSGTGEAGTSSTAVLEVRDHGPGVDPADADRLFERFVRADDARTRETGGAGLGLALVRAVVEAHHGRVGFVATPGGGATVRVTLPAGLPGATAGGPAGTKQARAAGEQAPDARSTMGSRSIP